MIRWFLHILNRLFIKEIPSPIEYERMQVASIQSEIRARSAEQAADLLVRENEDLRATVRSLQRRYDALIEHFADRPMPMSVPPITSQQRQAEEWLRSANRRVWAVTGGGGSYGRPVMRRSIPGHFTGTEPEDL